MGISANQARLMTLTARQHDLELRAQQISAMKMVTSMESQQYATEYSSALNAYSLSKAKQSATEGNSITYYTTNEEGEQVENTVTVNATSNSDTQKLFLDQVKARYDSAMARLSAEEKMLDMELTQINTEHNAVKTEYDAIKSLVSDNTEKSFNVFG